jgi:hypothetical protein
MTRIVLGGILLLAFCAGITPAQEKIPPQGQPRNRPQNPPQNPPLGLVLEVPGPKQPADANSVVCHMDRVVFSRDGKLMAAGAGPNVFLWNVADGKELLRMQLPEKQIYHRVMFSEDGKSLIWNGREDSEVRIFDTRSGRQDREFPNPKADRRGYCNFLCYSPDARLIAYNGPRFFEGLDMVDVATGQVVMSIPEVKDARGAAFSPDGKFIATHSGDGGLHIWDVKTGRAFRELVPHQNGAGGAYKWVTWSPDGAFLATGGHIQPSLDIWSLKSRKKVVSIPCRDCFYTAAFSPDGQSVLCTQSGGQPYLYHLIAEKETMHFNPPGREGLFLTWVNGQNRVAIIGAASNSDARQYSVYLYDVPTEILNPKEAQVDDAAPDKLWAELTSENELRLARVIKALLGAPKPTLSLFTAKLPPIDNARQTRIEEMVLQLGEADATRREEAMKELQQAAYDFAPLLESRVENAGPGEIRNRLRFILKQMNEKPTPARLVGELRALELLEQMKTPEARELIGKLAGGAAGARLTAEAKAIAERLKRVP